MKMMKQEARQIPVTIVATRVSGVPARTPIERTRRGEKMSSNEVKLVFTAHFKISGDSEHAIENAMERARVDYGNEIADFGEFTLEVEGD